MSQSISRDTSVRTPSSGHVTDESAHPQPSNGRSDVVVVPRRNTLDGFVEAVSHTKGVGLADVDIFTTLVVQTDNSVDHITILQPYTREVVVQGGAFFTTRTRARLNGSSFGGSCLKLGWAGVGLHMEFHAEDQWIITSHVRSIAVEHAEQRQPF